MKKIFIIWTLVSISFTLSSQIVADHSVVGKYDIIPQQYIDKVKEMLIDFSGESHTQGYRIGMNLLETQDSRFQVVISTGVPSAYTTDNLRFNSHSSVGEEDFFVKQSVIDSYKQVINQQNNTGNQYDVMGFVWCSDMYYGTPIAVRDPDHNIRWYGQSVDGEDGNKPWGLDSGDSLITGNRVNMDRYLDAVNQYNQFSNDNGYKTLVVFSTGPVDNDGGSGNLEATEQGFQREIKHNYIRDYVAANDDEVLFDYADILCHNNNGEKHITYWDDGGTIRPHANIHPDNEKDYDEGWNIISPTNDGDHIGEVGALRLAKAMWWMLARIAGWDGSVATNSEEVTADAEPAVIRVNGDELIIEMQDHSSLPAQISLHNLQGSLVKQKSNPGNVCSFNTGGLPAGIYLVVISVNGLKRTQKIFIQ